MIWNRLKCIFLFIPADDGEIRFSMRKSFFYVEIRLQGAQACVGDETLEVPAASRACVCNCIRDVDVGNVMLQFQQ